MNLLGINWGTGYSQYGNPASPVRATFSMWGYVQNELSDAYNVDHGTTGYQQTYSLTSSYNYP